MQNRIARLSISQQSQQSISSIAVVNRSKALSTERLAAKLASGRDVCCPASTPPHRDTTATPHQTVSSHARAAGHARC